MDAVPLSEDEQRILHEIERSFYENDPEFARGVRTAIRSDRHAGRNTKWSVAGFILGLLILLTQFASVFWFGAVGFLLMLGSAFVFVSNVRRMSRGGLSKVAGSFRAKNFGSALSERSRGLRQRFKRGDG